MELKMSKIKYNKNTTSIVYRNNDNNLECVGVLNKDVELDYGSTIYLNFSSQSQYFSDISNNVGLPQTINIHKVSLTGYNQHIINSPYKFLEVDLYESDFTKRYKSVCLLEKYNYIIPNDNMEISSYDQLKCVIEAILDGSTKSKFNMDNFLEYCKNDKEFTSMINYLTRSVLWK